MGDATIPSDWEGEFCKWAVCWPNSPQWLAVLRNALLIPSTGRYWNEDTGSILGAQEVIKQTFDTNLHLQGVLMSCGDESLSELAIALQAIAAQLGQQHTTGDCGCVGRASAGGGTTEPPVSTIPQGDPDTDPPPEGFDSWEEFFSDKCAIAGDILNQLQASLLNIGILNFGALTLDAMGIALAIAITLTIAAEVIIAIAALLISVAGEVIIATLLSVINDNEADLVCQLYKGESASDSLELFHTALGDYVDAAVFDPVEGYAVKTLARYMVNAEVVNRLYTKDLTKVWPTSNCADCLDCENLTWDFTDNLVGDWQVGTVFPACFELADPPACTLGASGGRLVMTGAAASPYYKGGAMIDGISWLVPSGWQVDVNINCSGASVLYIDCVVVTLEGSCKWMTLDNSFSCGSFAGKSVGNEDIVGEHIIELWLYCQSNSGAGSLTVEFEIIQLSCQA